MFRLSKTSLVIFLLSLFIALPLLQSAWQTNRDHLRILKILDLRQIDPSGRLNLRDPEWINHSNLQTPDPSCIGVWQSRIWASYDFQKAEEYLAQSEGCQRMPEEKHFWEGNLAYLQGDLEGAAAAWQKVSDRTLIDRTKNLVLAKKFELGQAMLGVLAKRAENWRNEPEQSSAVWEIGDVYRFAGKEAEALPYYLTAWEGGKRGYAEAFYLARGYRLNGNIKKAIEILEAVWSIVQR